MSLDKNDLYANPRLGLRIEDCQFYHTMEIPGVGLVKGFGGGNWDLRECINQMLGGMNFSGQRVIEVGPASGHVTFEMERRGARVVSIEAPFDHDWDVVPFPHIIDMWKKACKLAWPLVTNSWWFAHEHFKSNANVCYVSAGKLNEVPLGTFDIAVLANILLHNRDPLKIIQNCANITSRAILIAEQWQNDLESTGLPVVNFEPDPTPPPGQENWNMWWRFSTKYFINFLTILGFSEIKINRYQAPWNNVPIEYFTLIASKK
jgi:SAM-dependent methyltransferase